jgi:hypothetical protein
VDADGRLLVFLNAGGGRFTRERAGPAFGASCRGTHVVLADLDGDGRADAVASFAEERDPRGPRERCPSEGGLGAWRAEP